MEGPSSVGRPIHNNSVLSGGFNLKAARELIRDEESLPLAPPLMTVSGEKSIAKDASKLVRFGNGSSRISEFLVVFTCIMKVGFIKYASYILSLFVEYVSSTSTCYKESFFPAGFVVQAHEEMDAAEPTHVFQPMPARPILSRPAISSNPCCLW